ncbi:MAG TPA: class I tRNA ligase family protein [Bacteroidia bacterium]|nr:class I tRNA ligase family protein [Bacteroidia bacterium]HNU32396.1 class I tRNA ligase family protein [Bacteroidia bacterium]
MEYNFGEIEKKWQSRWAGKDKLWSDKKTFAADNNSSKEKYYVLDMFPYPSGAGLHVGHPLGYIASDIVARYKRHQGFNVLHPMGYDSFGLPAEQYAIQTGQHPAVTTEKNIARYREQLDKIGFSFDWDREVRTSDPDYYKWTQWIFIKLFNSWYNPKINKAESIDTLIPQLKNFSSLSEKEKSDLLMEYRLAYLSEAWVNWCPQLGTVLANEEVKDGVSERGGYPVERKLMPQWSLRITAYADRLLNDLDGIDWSESIREAQRNWIGKSEGTSLRFELVHSKVLPYGEDLGGASIEVFTTRPDTAFGVSFVTLAPEHELIEKITPASHKNAVAKYVDYAKNRSERERMADVKKITGQFTGAYVVHPFTQKEIPVWIGEYVLAGYGTGAVMGVPAHDSRDFAFAKHFDLERPVVILPDVDWDFENQSYDDKEGKCVNSDFLNGLEVKAAIKKCIEEIEKKNLGKGKTNYRLRDAIFGRQRYWGEPIPVYYKDGIPCTIEEKDLPLVLPEVDKYLPTETGEPPLARANNWTYTPHLNPPRGGGLSQPADSKIPAFQTADKLVYGEIKDHARDKRKNPTKAEEKLWEYLKDEQTGYKIRRQHIVDTFIADFVCLEKKVVIEVDGGYHQQQKDEDAARTMMINLKGFSVIRYTNEEVLNDPKSVQQKIKEELDSKVVADSKVLPNGEDLGGAYPLETTTMPGWAGSSWYYLRYMDANNKNEFVSKEAANYWKNVDLYIGGSEHATGHLLYVRFWTKFLHDLGYIPVIEPAKKLINQGMIQGTSQLAIKEMGARRANFELEWSYKIRNQQVLIKFPSVGTHSNYYLSSDFLPEDYPFLTSVHIDVNLVENNVLNISEYVSSKNDIEDKNGFFICPTSYWHKGHWYDFNGNQINGNFNFLTKPEVEKMSKSKYNVVTPDDIIEKHGADCLRLYEMFLGPLEQSKPWNTNGISGVSNFLRKFWRLFHQNNVFTISNDEPTRVELKSLHKTIKKVTEDIDRFSFNTSVSSFMICVNELADLKCNKRKILEPLCILISPYAPHIAEELWSKFGHTTSISTAPFPKVNEEYLTEDSFEYPVSVNGKTRFKINIELSKTKEEVETEVMKSVELQKYLNGTSPKKVIVVPGRIVNIVC